MSGWIKMGVGLRRHPKVVRMAFALKADKLRVIGALHAVWCVFDEHSDDGHLDCYTLAIMDDEIGWRGFSAAMNAIGWLIETPEGLQAPDYEEHNGASAKRRALDAQSKGKRRHSSARSPHECHQSGGGDCGQLSASHADTLRNREEKKQEIPPIAPQGGQDRPDIPCPYSAIVALYHEHLPSLPRAKLMPPARQRAMRKAWGWVLSSTTSDGNRRASTADEALHWLAGYFARANDNDFLMGRTPRSAEHKDWRCDIDFLLTDRGMRHVIERTQDAA